MILLASERAGEVLYTTQDRAAEGWSKAYGGWSASEGIELSSNIYEYSKSSVKLYNYTEASIGTAHSSPDPDQIKKPMPKGASLVGHIHSHGNFNSPDDLKFSYKAVGAPNRPYDQDMMTRFPALTFYMLNLMVNFGVEERKVLRMDFLLTKLI